MCRTSSHQAVILDVLVKALQDFSLLASIFVSMKSVISADMERRSWLIVPSLETP